MMQKELELPEQLFTKVYDLLIWKYHDVLLAIIYGKIERLTWNKHHYCYAAQETIAKQLGINRGTVNKKIKRLILDGYILDLTPSFRNKPHCYAITTKFSDDYSKFEKYAESIRSESNKISCQFSNLLVPVDGLEKIDLCDTFQEFLSFTKNKQPVEENPATIVEEPPTTDEEINSNCCEEPHEYTSNRQNNRQSNIEENILSPQPDSGMESSKNKDSIPSQSSREIEEQISLLNDDFVTSEKNSIDNSFSSQSIAGSGNYVVPREEGGNIDSDVETKLDMESSSTYNEIDLILKEYGGDTSYVAPDNEEELIFLNQWGRNYYDNPEQKFWFKRIFIHSKKSELNDENGFTDKFSSPYECIRTLAERFFPNQWELDNSHFELDIEEYLIKEEDWEESDAS